MDCINIYGLLHDDDQTQHWLIVVFAQRSLVCRKNEFEFAHCL